MVELTSKEVLVNPLLHSNGSFVLRYGNVRIEKANHHEDAIPMK